METKHKVALTVALYQGDRLLRRDVVAQDIIKVGRDPKNHLRVDDEAVSRIHALIEVVAPDDVTLIDLGNEPGTLVDGARVGKRRIGTGDHIVIGATTLVLEKVELGRAAEPPAAANPFASANPFAAAVNQFVVAAEPAGVPVTPMSGLREDDSDGSGLLRLDDAPEAATVPGRPASAVEFGFTPRELKTADVQLAEGQWRFTPDRLGLADRRRELIAGSVDAEEVRAAVSRFVDKKRALEQKGASFAHLKQLPRQYPEFARWFDDLVSASKGDANECKSRIVDSVRTESLRWLATRATEAYGNDQQIDREEWSVLVRDARNYLGMADAVADDAVLATCRRVTGNDSWTPPAASADSATIDKTTRALEEQQRVLAEQVESIRAEQLKLRSTAALESAELQRRAQELEAKQAEIDSRVEAARQLEVEAAYRRDHAASAAAQAEANRAWTQQAAWNAYQQQARAQTAWPVQQVSTQPTHYSGMPYSEKTRVTAALLQFFLGFFGAGRWYTGHKRLAFAQLAVCIMTGGLPGILWPWIDGVFMILGRVSDAEGRPLR